MKTSELTYICRQKLVQILDVACDLFCQDAFVFSFLSLLHEIQDDYRRAVMKQQVLEMLAGSLCIWVWNVE